MLPPAELAAHIRIHLEEDPKGIAAHLKDLPDGDVADVLNRLTIPEAAAVLTLLPVERATRICNQAIMRRRGGILDQLDPAFAAEILKELSSDQRADVVRQMSPHEKHRLLPKLPPEVQSEVQTLLQYPPHSAGGIMTTEFVRLDPAMTVGQALKFIRSVARERETIYACYILEPGSDKLLGAVSLRDLVMAELGQPLVEVMRKKPITVNATDDREVVAQKISKYNLLAVPVLEKDGKVVGFVTVDDVVDVLIEEGTEDILRLGAVEPGALDIPYMATPLFEMVRRRAPWLVVLFLGETLTATVMPYFEKEIQRAVVLALFIPLIISSGGNSGSQATTLIIRALALREMTLGEWWKVMWREIISGLALGVILGTIGFLRIALWTVFTDLYGPHWMLVGVTVGLSLVGIVLWGTLAGSMLPFILKRFGADPAASSAPFVATLVDVTGLVIYFSVAMVVLHGTLL